MPNEPQDGPPPTKQPEAKDKAEAKSTTFVLKRFYLLSKAFFGGEGRGKARLLLGMLLALVVIVGLVQVVMSYAARDFVTALVQRDATAWKRNLWRYLATFVLSIPIGVLYRYTQERLSLSWRQWMTQHLIKRYFFNRAYYNLHGSECVDNPDQRIAEDVRLFTTGTVNYFLIILNSLATLFGFLGVLWATSGQLVGVLVVYAIVGTAVSMLIGRRLVGLYFHQYQKEADFRYGLIRVGDNAESIAFFRGEKREHRDLIRRLGLVLTNAREIINWNRNLGFFANGYNYVALIIPALIVGPLYMAGKVEFGVVTQAESAFAQVLAALSIIIAQFESLSSFTAGIKRLGGLWDSLDEFDEEEKRESSEEQVEISESKGQLALAGLTVKIPRGDKTLSRDLDLELAAGQSVFITGESGGGKSSLLRTIAGLWRPGGGTITRPMLKHMMFLPQKPYMVEGNLRAQLMYPLGEEGADDAAIRAAIEEVNLKEILDRVDDDLGQSIDWTNVLSLGEQQRVSFARLFLQKPQIAFLDEATSALDEANERMLYEKLRESGTSFVSVGHRSTLKEFHQRLLMLKRDGSFELKDIVPEESLATPVRVVPIGTPAAGAPLATR